MDKSIKELIEYTNCKLIINVDIEKNFYCELEDCWIKDGPILRGLVGRSDTIYGAIANFLHQIRGKQIVSKPDIETFRKVFCVIFFNDVAKE